MVAKSLKMVAKTYTGLTSRFVNQKPVPVDSAAYVGLAPPGPAGSWQIESKVYLIFSLIL